ncbi:nitrogenase cofactor biosynthesis protein NifB [Petroclostridium sp. X23]|uniref:nitrogenase cofactor biosynthesis protein NifB n=1 Tax=Petroclostridium sp. X23 TaxID=3045146 RepID=UPI0024AE41BB|nr:nitrogenase cofactor biosynthesis protein NifB [Petroclostridium sp. X23]WHH56961.1 nitrogenase cofactor biosynthesis protein NifB [Petroclostridium sp. X23]
MSSRNFVNLNINPCKMCMPMGAVMAFKGIQSSMMILHGSQGCSTYIRRHMATHYNEPVDIASSSLTEQGTVYGGEENLKKAIKNVIKTYHPQMIGIATTCLAETIGEDIARMISEFKQKEEELKDLSIIPVSTPGYGGTQFEGYFAALRDIVKYVAKDTKKNGEINIVTTNLNPADIRHMKDILKMFEAKYVLLPDISVTLDSPYSKQYTRISDGGTKISDIASMAGAAATIEMGMTVEDRYSPGKYLEETFGVPLYKCPIPMGLRSTDEFIKLLSKLTGKLVPRSLTEERGRYLDGMIDSHKYNAEGRAVIYGEPEQVFAVVKLCCENGVKPVLIASGSKNELFKDQITKELARIGEECLILDDTDFDTIQKYAKELKANILIGNSDGKWIEEKEGIPLVRIGFPVHDRIGAQRKINIGYYGSMRFLDEITNTILEKKESTYRKRMYKKYYWVSGKGEDKKMKNPIKVIKPEMVIKSIEEKTKTHPCYNQGAHDYARMHIPVAPKCNISCNYCSRKYDCLNESRPGVTSEVLSPQQALEKYIEVKSKVKNLSVVGIAGPGDALANFEETKETLRLIRQEDPEVTFCLSTNGLMLPFYANDLIELGVSHLTITINTVDPKIGAKIYKYVNYLGTKYEDEEAAWILLYNQLAGLKYLSERGMLCKVNIVMVKGVNDHHIEEVVKKVKEHGAFMTNIMQMIPAPGSVFENIPLVSNKEVTEMRKKCEVDLKQMYHCRQCRADAIGTLGNDCSAHFRGKCGSAQKCTSSSQESPIAENIKYKFAVASKSGMLIDQHFGHAEEFYIYEFNSGEVNFLEKRTVSKYCTGKEECEEREEKTQKVIRTVSDCDGVIVLRIGYEPQKKLENLGIQVIQMYEEVEKGVIKAVEQMQKEKKVAINC